MKYLHNNRELFNDTVLNTSNFLNIEAAIIEKDYYVTVLLKELIANNSDIIFKGGTSLSKCYKVINRFSEDIDIGVNADKATEGIKRKLKGNIVDAIKKCGFELDNEDDIKSRRDFNRYRVKYPLTQAMDYIKPYLFVETAVFLKPYPYEVKSADSYVYRFLSSNGYYDIIEEYNLKPFETNVQTLERTFIDKLFALGDYYLTDKVFGHSRHLYDILKIMPRISFDEAFYKLFEEVRSVRALDKECPSANPDVSLRDLLVKICKKDYYKSDYEAVTYELLFESVSYEEAKKNLMEIIDKL